MALNKMVLKVEGTKHKKEFRYKNTDQLESMIDSWLYHLETKGDIRDATTCTYKRVFNV